MKDSIMRVFVTGATGFIGSHLVPELVAAGHQVAGLSRSDAGARSLEEAGVEVVRGDLADHDVLRDAADHADAVVHLAFNHDPAGQQQHSEEDRQVISVLGSALAATDGPLIVTSGTGLVVSQNGGPVLETDRPAPSSAVARGATEEAADALIDEGRNVIIVRLPQVHDTLHQGRLHWHIEIAREKGRVAYIGDGANRVPAVHVSDAAHLYRLALERGAAGSRYHAVAEEGIPLRPIAEAIGRRLDLPVESLAPGEAEVYFGWLSPLAALDLPASGVATRELLGWAPSGPSLLADLAHAHVDDRTPGGAAGRTGN
jgi:nucleoside-diphosphate-sugar epimerase